MKKQFFFLFFLLPFALQAQIADSIIRKVPLQGAMNFRDIGGYQTQNGKHVKWGKIYRSAEINKLTDADLDTLKSRNINYVLDFRGPTEVETAPDKLPVGATRISLPAGSENVGNKIQMMQMMVKASSGDSIMLPFYNNTEPFSKRYKPMFQTLLNNSKDSALLFHCTAGKDRTGIGAALILYALGVDEKTIMADYLASNYYRQGDNQRMKKMLVENYHMKEEVVEEVIGVKEKYLAATFSAIRTSYGSVENFLKTEMGLSKKELKKLRKKFTK
jgi:protein-tyrosine phosphatase